MWLPTILFVVFTLLSVVGAYLIGRPKSSKLALLLAALTLLFFLGLGAGLLALLRTAPHV
ncbi:MAG TPA: hypothetical protein VGS22_17175 [Thermoanaerobaculia bacterium]|jgi:hypothetical protein|nr:hypothetical protein [Thermoanaerobaculia bacterium]